MTNIRTGAAILLGAVTISFVGAPMPAGLAHADTSAVSTAHHEAVLVTSHSFTATEQAFVADVESMSWYPASAVGDTDLETGMVKLGWTVVPCGEQRRQSVGRGGSYLPELKQGGNESG
ncbi:MAG TPA: hypothetical protein VGC05_24830 [Mycobacterium sp.]